MIFFVSKKYTFWLMTEFVRECRKKRAEHEAFFRLFYARRMPAVPAACFAVTNFFLEKVPGGGEKGRCRG